MVKKIISLFNLFLFMLFSCGVPNKNQVILTKNNTISGLPILNDSNPENQEEPKKIVIYKTKNDYSSFVPIHLSKDKMNIIGYPAKEDLKQFGNSNSIATENGYYIDLVGVNLNTVFTSYTLESYQKINIPTLEDFKNQIIIMNPFEEMYICNDKFKNVELEQFIKTETLSKYCSKIK